MELKESLDVNHAEDQKKREWNFHKSGMAGKFIDLLKSNFPHYLYDNASEGLGDVESKKSFEVNIFRYKNKGNEMAVNVPAYYFKAEGYNEIIKFIDGQYNKIK